MTIKTFTKKAIKAILPYGLVLGIKRVRGLFLFKKMRKRADAVLKLLTDDNSKKVYLGIIKARCGLCEACEFYTRQAQYFENEFFKYGENEFLIDCGAYTGDTIDEFIKFVPNYRGIISFEATPSTFEILKENHGNNPKIQLINKGVWNGVSKITFITESGNNSRFHNAANRISPSDKNRNAFRLQNLISIDTTSIDILDLQEKVTLIKMDIEGSELEALKGARKTILRDKPRLAISIYHSNDDMFRIAEYIHEILPQYKLYVRHHWINNSETVLYGCE